MHGTRRAVLVGCNYPGARRELHGCINDVVAMYNTLVDRFGFDSDNIVMLTDAENGIMDTDKPTGKKIRRALRNMIDQTEAGDVLLFHFSGHGTLLNGNHDDAIVPCDHNLITDHDFRKLVNLVPNGASFTILSDSCHSGGLIDNEKEQIGPHMSGNSGSSQQHKSRGIHHHEIVEHLSSMSGLDSDDIGEHLVHLYGDDASPIFRNEGVRRNVRVHHDNGILLSGCQLNELSRDVRKGKPHGAFTDALLSVLGNHNGPISNRLLLTRTRKVLQQKGFATQHPCLYCSDSNAKAPFLFEE